MMAVATHEMETFAPYTQISNIEYARLLKTMKLQNFPREVSFSRHMVKSYRALMFYYRDRFDWDNLYISTNSYYDFNKYFQPTNIYLTNTLVDLDTAYQPSIGAAWSDTLKCQDFFEDHYLDYTMQHSCGGYHFIPQFKGKIYTLNPETSAMIRTVQDHLNTELGLPTINIQTAEPRRMMRMPFSIHQDHRRYCIPLPQGYLSSMSNAAIIDESRHPILHPSYKSGNKKSFTLQEYIKYFDLKPRTTSSNHTPQTNGQGQLDINNILQDLGDELLPSFLNLFIHWPCLTTALADKNPPHIIRLSACAFLRPHLSFEDSCDLFTHLANGFRWNDRANTQHRCNQISSVYKMQYHPSTCENILATLSKKYPSLSIPCDTCPRRNNK